jgi:hypothetical protein
MGRAYIPSTDAERQYLQYASRRPSCPECQYRRLGVRLDLRLSDPSSSGGYLAYCLACNFRTELRESPASAVRSLEKVEEDRRGMTARELERWVSEPRPRWFRKSRVKI